MYRRLRPRPWPLNLPLENGRDFVVLHHMVCCCGDDGFRDDCVGHGGQLARLESEVYEWLNWKGHRGVKLGRV